MGWGTNSVSSSLDGSRMKRRAWYVVAALSLVLVGGLVAACTSAEPTPTPPPPTPTVTPTFTPTPSPTPIITPSPTPVPTLTPTPSPTPTFTPTPVPTPTPAPSPTPTFTPTPSPTPTPTPTFTPTPTNTPTPTPTPTPSLQDVLPGSEPAMVLVQSGVTQWSGVMVDSAGFILTTSINLDSAPLVDFTTFGGVTGRAWVTGRDDSKDVALLEVIDPQGPYPSLPITAAPVPPVDEGFLTMGFPTSRGGNLDRKETQTVGVRQDFNTGIRYLQLSDQRKPGAEGSGLVDRHGVLRGLRMEESHMIALGFGRIGEVYAMGVDALALLLPQLQSGVLKECRSTSTTVTVSPGAPPGITPTYAGAVFIGGAAPPDGTLLYSRVVKAGLPDWWVCISFPLAVGTTGNYAMGVGGGADYNGGTVEFWTNGKKALQTSTYTTVSADPLRPVVVLNLTFS